MQVVAYPAYCDGASGVGSGTVSAGWYTRSQVDPVTAVRVVAVVILYVVGSVVNPTSDSCLFPRSATVNRVQTAQSPYIAVNMIHRTYAQRVVDEPILAH